MANVHKVIVTNLATLKRKHGANGLKRIQTAVNKLIKADARRGISTELIGIDRAADMKGIGKRVTKTKDPRQAKRAIDAVCDAHAPHYLVILGAPDVIPHVPLKNPVYDGDVDVDREVESDLPYACDAKYGRDIVDFLGPTRVVGRIPDVLGQGGTAHLVSVLNNAAKWTSKPRSVFERHFCVTAEAWKGSTRRSIRKLFGTQAGVKMSPYEGPRWSKTELGGKVHFINCHGDTRVSKFYGENEVAPWDTPIAHLSTHLGGRIPRAAIVAAECCYGAELYEPTAEPMGICQRYLGEGASGFFGSTNIAYGPAQENEYADVLCGYFVRAVLDGASLGRAALLARQKYISRGGHMGPHDLKTLAQFILLGDPSIHPVELEPKKRAKAKRRPVAKARRRGAAPPMLQARSKRRTYLRGRGRQIGVTTASVSSKMDVRPTAKLRKDLEQLRQSRGLSAGKLMSFRLHGPAKPTKRKSASAKRLKAGKTAFHIIVGTSKLKPISAQDLAKAKVPRRRRAALAKAAPLPRPQVKTGKVLVAREVNGKIDRIVEIHRH
ncbi:MAG: hypothetical protein JSW58_14200 [Candidatus Latescibacterota bacterium]|nr:MAG: hypothetical protein JSW58_14200 [Candidatus Latescibacterota bacterium]